jgi:hypothetical protein
VADVQRLTDADQGCAMPTADAAPRRASRTRSIISATVRDGNTVVNLPDHSTLAFLGSASLDQITFLDWDSARPVWQVIRSSPGRR